MRRVLESNRQVRSDVLRLNSCTNYPKRQQGSFRKDGLMKWRVAEGK